MSAGQRRRPAPRGSSDTPHFQIRVADGGGVDFRIAVNVKSQQAPSELLYLARRRLPAPGHGRTAAPPAAAGTPCRRSPGAPAWTSSAATCSTRADAPAAPDAAGPTTTSPTCSTTTCTRAIADPAARVYAFGAALGPGGGTAGQGVRLPARQRRARHPHEPGQRSASSPATTASGRTAALLIHFPAATRWVGDLPRLPEPGLAHRRRHRPHDRGPAADAPARRRRRVPVRIVAALVNPVGPAPERETVLLLNASPSAVDLTGWRIADRLKRTFPLPPRAWARERCSRSR